MTSSIAPLDSQWAATFDHVVGAAHDEQIAILVELAGIAGQVVAPESATSRSRSATTICAHVTDRVGSGGDPWALTLQPGACSLGTRRARSPGWGGTARIAARRGEAGAAVRNARLRGAAGSRRGASCACSAGFGTAGRT